MVSSQSDNKETQDDLSEIRRKLVWRMGVAGLMIVALLGGLALFDRMTAPRSVSESTAPQFTEPVPVPKKSITQPLTPVESGEEKKPAAPESTATPVDKSAPPVGAPPKPEVAATPSLPRSAAQAGRPAAPAGPAAPVAVAPVRPSETKTAAASTATARSEPQALPQPLSPLLPKLLSGYTLQAGVFSDPRRAEELHARLTLEGIPSVIEARVQVGPFKNRQEAEAARARMKAMGIESVMQLPKGAKR